MPHTIQLQNNVHCVIVGSELQINHSIMRQLANIFQSLCSHKLPQFHNKWSWNLTPDSRTKSVFSDSPGIANFNKKVLSLTSYIFDTLWPRMSLISATIALTSEVVKRPFPGMASILTVPENLLRRYHQEYGNI